MEGIAGIQYREMNGVQIPVLEGVMSEEKILASLNRYGRIAAQEMKRTDQAQYEMMLLSGKLMERLMKIQTEAEEYHEKLAESLLKTWTREDRTDPYNTLEMTNLRIQADMEAQKQVMEEIIHPRIGYNRKKQKRIQRKELLRRFLFCLGR